MSTEEHARYERLEFLRRAGLLGAGLSLSGAFGASQAGAALSRFSSANASVKGGTLSVGSVDFLPHDWYIGTSLGAQLTAFTQMAWPLFIGGGGDGRGLVYQNGLASAYHASADGLTHTITLRGGMKFHDGSPIDAAAVAENLKISFFKNNPLRDKGTYLQVVLTLGDPPIVKSVTARDARTVVVVLTQPRIDIKTALAFTPILKPTIFSNKTYGTDVKALGQSGSGPFRLTSFQAGSFAEFERFTGFFEPVLPDRIHLQAITDSGALALALRSGQVSVAEGLAKPDWDTLAKSGFQRIVADASVEADLLIGYPKDHALADKRVRRAVALAMNRQAYSSTFFNSGTAVVSSNPIVNPGMAGYVASLKPAPYSPKAAQALMAAAGVKTANLGLVVPTVEAPVSSMPGIAQAIANDLEKIGIKMKVTVSDPASLSGGIGKHAFESTIVAPGGQPDPFILFELFARKAAYYAPGYLSQAPSVTKALNAAEKARTTAQRNRYLQQIITTMVDDSLIIPISSVGYSVLAKQGVKNFALSGTQIDSWHRVSGLPG